ncbi:MAG: DEAD/DEAH box helicase [Bacteroidota bacterium]
MPDGTIGIIPIEWFAKYKELFVFGKSNKESIELSSIHSHILLREFKNKGLNFGKIEEIYQPISLDKIILPKGIEAELRTYQKIGFAWLNRLKNNNLGGCLADDMGLGKTLQFICLLKQVIDEQDETIIEVSNLSKPQLDLFSLIDNSEPKHAVKNSIPSLIVVPTSLVHNWENEFNKFSPKIKYKKYIGANRSESIELFNEYDAIITTYGVIRNDITILKNIPFEILAIDEAQYIKNPQSKTYKAILEIQSKYKVALSGTPIENSLSDLWAQLNFLNRGILGSYSYFKREYQSPIEKRENLEKQDELLKIVSPFILRRTKQEVAKDLPELTEKTIFCTMAEEQKNYYEELKSKIRNKILEGFDNPIEKQHRNIHILKGLMQLRLLANHPSILDNNLAIESGKFEEIKRSLDKIVLQGHKVLIFSSFVKHLMLFVDYFKQQKWNFSLLTGQTELRQEEVAKFQQTEDCKLFLVSLKAGGVGLNITAADYVFLLDPWWNLAAEKQAISRAHRIGRQDKIFVYRFITQNTIEEKIQHLQSKKENLSETFVNSKNILKYLKESQINEIFE